MTDRENLKARAAELGLKFPPNIGDEKLQARVAEAEAEAENAAQPPAEPASPGDAPEETTGDDTPEQAPEPAPATTDQPSQDENAAEPPKEPRQSVWRINCVVAGGRRRADRRWAGGVTDISVAELSKDQLASLDADPMFTVELIEAKK